MRRAMRACVGAVGRAGGAPVRTRGRRGGAARLVAVGSDDGAEVLGVDRPGLAFGERGGGVRGDADAGVPVAGVEDVGAVPRRGHPGVDDRLRRRQPEGAPGDVLADFVADAGVGDVAGGAHPVGRGRAVGGDVGEVVLSDHFFGVALGGALELGVWPQRALAGGGAFAVDQAEDGGADFFEVARRRCQGGAGACAGGPGGLWRGEAGGAGGRRRRGGEGADAEQRGEGSEGTSVCHVSGIDSPAC